MESAQHREGNRQRVRTEGRWYNIDAFASRRDRSRLPGFIRPAQLAEKIPAAHGRRARAPLVDARAHARPRQSLFYAASDRPLGPAVMNFGPGSKLHERPPAETPRTSVRP